LTAQLPHRVSSFCKRILVCSTHATPPIAAGLIFLVSEVCRLSPNLIQKLITTVEPSASPPASSGSAPPEDSYFLLGNFDASKRNPTYACKDSANSWEMVLFKSHFNPSVKLFATSFLEPTSQHTISYSGDPTIDFSITSFLNRFAYKNPKKQQLEQRRKRSQVLSEEPVNTSAFLETSTEVAPEKIFFYKFFGERNRLIAEGKSRKKKRRVDEDDDENEDRSDLGSDFDEAEIDRFADKLADELMDNYSGKVDIDDDDEDLDDFDEDGDDFDGEGDGDLDDEGAEVASDNSQFDGLDGEEDFDAADDDEEDDDDDESFDFEEEEVRGKKSKKSSTKASSENQKKRKKGDDDDVFAAAADFEDDMEANIVGVVGYEASPHTDSKSKHSKKRSRRA
jgi:ribosome biogenesis protein MAK21